MTTEKPKNGLHTEYYDKGQMKLEENYKDGKKDGKWTKWCCDGTLRTEENYKDGELID